MADLLWLALVGVVGATLEVGVLLALHDYLTRMRRDG